MRNVHFRVDEAVVLEIRSLSGSLISTHPGETPVFDDKASFYLKIRSAEIAMNSASLANLMNRYVFADPDSPLKKISINIEGDQIRQKAKLGRVGVPIEMTGKLDVTPEGRIRLHPTAIKLMHMPVRGLMSLFKLKLGKLIDLKKARGVETSGNDIVMDPGRMLPPPRIEGRISTVRMEPDRLVQFFGEDRPSTGRGASNFMHYRGGTLRFGKLTMHDADLKIVDQAPKDPFDFFLDHYKDQLVAGYSKTTPSLGLEVFMPDFAALRPARVAGAGSEK
ncbi:MAG TPA: hypothetical protein VFW15_05770 [Thermoanaerobaculia bacterium]|nr:hypothetical protein [Thermoanaerobaculia bacterium]